MSRRGWVTREQFVDLLGATNLIPGPNSTEMAIHIGYLRAGWPGLAVAGAAFILPAALITGFLAWAYLRVGSVPAVAPFFGGIQPAVLAVILASLLKLGWTAVKNTRLAALGLLALVAATAGTDALAVLLGGGLLGMIWLRLAGAGKRVRGDTTVHAGATLFSGISPRPMLIGMATAAIAGTGAAKTASLVPLWKLGLFFLKVGSILYGGGYVLVAFLQNGLVDRYGWLTQKQLLDAVAFGQFTPGPVLSTATFIGYLLAGVPGAAIATAGIFLPSFLFVAAVNPLIPRLRRSRWMSSFLDSVNVCAVALMAAVTLSLASGVLSSWSSWIIATVAAFAVLRWKKINPAWIVLGGAAAGGLAGFLQSGCP